MPQFTAHSGLITSLRGKIVETAEDFMVVEVGGVGYGVRVTRRCAEAARGRADFTIFIHDHITENRRDLYGFASLEERDLFRVIMTTKGIGPMTAIRAVSVQASWVDIAGAIAAGDLGKLKAMKMRGIGPKSLQALVIDCRDTCAALLKFYSRGADAQQDMLAPLSSAREDAVSALVNLGFEEKAVREAMRNYRAVDGAEVVDVIVKAMLPVLTRRS